jgi:glycosyltransferase involved in cell wall biosynthesis
MRVLVVSNLYPPDFLGGYEILMRQLADRLRADGHVVRVLTSLPRAAVPREPHVRRTLRLTDVWDLAHRANLSGPARAADDAASALVDAGNVHELATTVEDFGPDVVLVGNLVGVGGLGLMGCLVHLGVPWVWYLSDNVPRSLCYPGGRLVPALARQFGRQLRGRFLACTSRLVEQVEAAGVPLGGRVEVVPNWVAGERPAPRSNFYRPGRPLRVVTAGRLGPLKGIDLLVEAFGLLKAWGCAEADVTLDVFGSDAEVGPAHYPSLIERHGVSNLVHLEPAG